MTTTPTTADNYTFYATREYFEQLQADISQTSAGDKILLATMAFDPAVPQIAQLCDALLHAAQRGAIVHLSIDAYNFLVTEKRVPGPLFFKKTLPAQMPKYLEALHNTLKRLQAAGVTVATTNMPLHRFSMPFAGRSHAKISIINDTIYLGGCNLEQQHLDCMVQWQDPKTAAWLYNLFLSRFTQTATLKALGTTDIRQQIDSHSELFFDVGVKKQSLILQEALAVIDRAKKWLVITCQYFPNSITARHLRMARRRGVKVVILFNHYKQHAGPHRYLQQGVTRREQLRMPPEFFTHQLPEDQTYLHAKIVASETEAIIGSHNYITVGVNLGTAEIALHNTTAEFSSAVVRLIAHEVNKPDIIDSLRI